MSIQELTTKLELQANSFSGTLPTELGSLKRLTSYFDVDNNELTGCELGFKTITFLMF